MSEQKSKYVPGMVYTQQFTSPLPAGWGDASEETITPIPSSLPTLLAQMVNEYDAELCKRDMFGDYVSSRLQLVNHFNTILLSAAQPHLAAYLDMLANPPMVVKQSTPADYLRTEEAMEMARTGNKEAARKHLGLDDPHERDEAIAKTLSYRTYLMALPADQVAIPYQEWRKSLGAK